MVPYELDTVDRDRLPWGPIPIAQWLLASLLVVPWLVGSAWGQLVSSTSAPAWTAIGLGGGGALYTPAISPADPKRILLGCDMSGAYRLTDGGKNWEMIHYRHLMGSTTVRPAWHPIDPEVAFAVNGWRGSLKMTKDGGKTWGDVPGAPSSVSAIEIDPDCPERMLLGTHRGIVRSTDGGKSWVEVGTERERVLGFHFDRTSPVENRTCFAATGRGILRSDGGGTSWRDVGAKFATGPIVSFSGGSNPKGGDCVLYCSVESREKQGQITGGIYLSDDRGSTWAARDGAGHRSADGTKEGAGTTARAVRVRPDHGCRSVTALRLARVGRLRFPERRSGRDLAECPHPVDEGARVQCWPELPHRRARRRR